ncbi:MAG: hypothetical protein HYW23_01475 [Candidatus Aenigmarchaeota archaeon]|nr:hypothetical protein [Candidatus Aenigmarchaeota archaeon]
MLEVDQDGVRYGITFFRSSKHLPYRQILDLVNLATLMHLCGADEKKVETDDYRGRMYTRKEYRNIESCGGIVYYAELETAKGDDAMWFLVSEQTPSRRLNFSLS